MAKIYARPDEPIESMLRRFKRSVNDEGILADIKKHEEYRSKGQKRREALNALKAKKRRAMRKAMQRQSRYRRH